MKEKNIQLIHLIAWLASDFGIKLTRIQIIKFLYLADLYHARAKGEIITGLPWAFVYYGPYCSEAMDTLHYAVSSGLLNEKSYPSRFSPDDDYYLYEAANTETPAMLLELPSEVISELKYAIKNWGSDTSGLLDYVYFETEPMRDVHKGDSLNFSKAQWPARESKIVMNTLSKDKIAAARKALDGLRKKTDCYRESWQPKSLYDQHYLEFIEKLAEPELETGMQGTAELKV